MRPSRQLCRGMTLIELMAAATLSGLLMLALMQVIVAIGRDGRLMEAQSTNTTRWTDRFRDVLRRDLDAAHSCRWEDNRLVLEGAGGWDNVTLAPIHEPSRVSYLLLPDRRSADGSGRVTAGSTDDRDEEAALLVREQSSILDLGQNRPYRTLMAVGVTAFEMFEPVGQGGLGRTAPDETVPTGRDALPAGAQTPRLTLKLSGGAEIHFTHDRLPRSADAGAGAPGLGAAPVPRRSDRRSPGAPRGGLR